MRYQTFVAACLALASLALAPTVDAAEIRVLCANGMKGVMEELGPRFERASGHHLALSYGPLGELVKRVQGGEAADVVLIPQQGLDALVKDGKASGDAIRVVARSGIGIAVRKGAPRPDISSPEAFKRTLLAAKSITYTNPAFGSASGLHMAKLLDRLGISEEMKAKTIFAPKPGGDGPMVANGEVDLTANQLQELAAMPGIEIVGPLPADLQSTIVFSAAVLNMARDAGASTSLVDFLRTAESTSVIKAKGMEAASTQ